MTKAPHQLCCAALLSTVLLTPGTAAAAPHSSETIQRAMQDELARNIEKLRIDNLAAPFFVSYSIRQVQSLEVVASQGAIVSSNLDKFRRHTVRVMVGNYQLNDENFFSFGGSHWSGMPAIMPIDDDYQAIRRTLWRDTDDVYKSAAEQFEQKKAVLAQQTQKQSLDDFARAPRVRFAQRLTAPAVDEAHWHSAARKISLVFADYPEVFDSKVRIFLYWAELHFVNSEGSSVIQPLTLAAIQASAATQATDGAPLFDHVVYYSKTAADLPPLKSVERATKTMCHNLTQLRRAPVFEGAYTGPVLLVDQASAEFFAQSLFGAGSGLLAQRRPVVADQGAARFLEASMGNSLEEKIGRRILARDLSVAAQPATKSFQQIPCLGHYAYDGEGVAPAKSLQLVQNGILKNLLNNRIPIARQPTSNGHARPLLGTLTSAGSQLGPSVIQISSSQGKTRAAIKKQLLRLAREEGLDYGIMIRKLQTPVAGPSPGPNARRPLDVDPGAAGRTLSHPILVYRVSVKDGKEQLVRSAKLGPISLTTLRHIKGSSKKRQVYNTLVTSSGPMKSPSTMQGAGATFIVPSALLLEELDVNQEKRDFTPTLPFVASPLAVR